MIITEKAERRLWAKIAPPDENGCMLWLAGKCSNGYGNFWVNGGTRLAHRVVYELLLGEIPDGLQIDHVTARGCRSRACCRVDHLEPVTSVENTRRGDSPPARAQRTNCCIRGHEFTPENTYARADSRRQCRICRRDWKRRYRTFRRAAA